MERPRLNPAVPAPAGATHAVAGQPVSRANENESRPVVVEPRQGAPLAETRRYETAAPRGQAPAAPAARPERPPPAPATAPAPAPTQDPRSH
jgi:hypothetical protein